MLDARRHLILKRGLNEDNTTNPTTRNNKKTRGLFVVVVVMTCFPPTVEGGGWRRMVHGWGWQREKHHTEIRVEGGGGFIQDSSPVYVSEHERGITSVDRRTGQRAGWQ